ncbi:MAG: hypothetical protein RLZZ387_5692 [Chloroflexota bacterium]|jgi:hypothetical protein
MLRYIRTVAVAVALALALGVTGCGSDPIGGQGGAAITEPTMFPAESAAGESSSDVDAGVREEGEGHEEEAGEGHEVEEGTEREEAEVEATTTSAP